MEASHLLKTCENLGILLPLHKDMIDDFIDSLLEKNEAVVLRHEDCLTLDCPSDSILEFVKNLQDRKLSTFWLAAIDHGVDAEIRFSVVLHLYSRSSIAFVFIHHAMTTNRPVFTLSKYFLLLTGMNEKLSGMFGIAHGTS